MTDPLTVSANEHGVVRVFTLGSASAANAAPNAEVATAMIGASSLDVTKVEIVQPSVLGTLGLSGYLSEGYGVPDAELAPVAGTLDAITAPVVIVPSSAFRGEEQTLRPREGLALVGTFREAPAQPHEVMPSARSAEGAVPPAETTADPATTGTRRGPSGLIVVGGLILAAIVIALLAL